MDFKTLADGLGVADVVDAMMMTHVHRAHILELDSPDSERVLIGPALTISFLPVRKDLMDAEKHSLGPAIYRAIAKRDPKGTVLVMASNGYTHTSLGGGTKLSRLENLGMAGILADGMLRDYEEGGVTVVPGDVIFARGSTAVAIPGSEAETILTKARRIMEKMNQVKESLKSEDPETVLNQGSSEL